MGFFYACTFLFHFVLTCEMFITVIAQPRGASMEQKHFTGSLEIKSLDEGGCFEGYASVFGVQDSDGDVIVKGAFKESLDEFKAAGRMPKMLWQHDTRQIIGKWVEMYEDDNGLYVKGRMIMEVRKVRRLMPYSKKACLMPCLSASISPKVAQPVCVGWSLKKLI